MDLKALREEVIEITSRALSDKHGFVPSEDSEEWEEEYRRQFELARRRHTGDGAADARPAAAPAAPAPRLAELDGTPEHKRWAAAIREDRLREVQDREIRAWLARDWTRAKAWIDTRDLPPATFTARARVWFAEHRKQAVEKAKAVSSERQSEAAAAAAVRQRLEAAGITAEGLIELIDASERLDPAPIRAKLAEVSCGDRTLRVYETDDVIVLLVKEKHGAERTEYAIERDDGLAADLKLFAEAQSLL